MNIAKITWAALVCLISLSTLSYAYAAEQAEPQQEQESIPWYFVTVYNEPFNTQQHQFYTEESYNILKQMVAKADEYHIKLTLMFAPSWADYLLSNNERAAEFDRWKKNGHEIGAYHHSVEQDNWDGYSLLPQPEAEAQRVKMGHPLEAYHGTLTDLITKMRQLNPELKSGCMNDERGKGLLTDAIVYDTCSGFANFGEPGRFEPDMDPEKGRNDYLSVGTYNDIERKWLTHYFMTTASAAENAFNAMHSGVYGVVNHSVPHELQVFLDYLDFLHSVDPQAKKSRTVSEIIEQKLLPEKKLPTAQVNTIPPQPPAAGLPPKGYPSAGPQENP